MIKGGAPIAGGGGALFFSANPGEQLENVKQILSQVGPEYTEASNLEHLAVQYAYAVYAKVSNFAPAATLRVSLNGFVSHFLNGSNFASSALWAGGNSTAMEEADMRIAFAVIRDMFLASANGISAEENDVLLEIAAKIVSFGSKSFLYEVLTIDAGRQFFAVSMNQEADELDYWSLGKDPAEFLNRFGGF